MKNVFKILGILCIIAAAVFITACPPGEEDETFTVTFTGLGIANFTKTVVKDKTLTRPDDPTYVLKQGLYLNPVTTPAFIQWEDADGAYVWTKPVTEDFTLTATWNGTAPNPIILAGNDDIVCEAITKVNTDSNTSNGYTLLLADAVTNATKSVNFRKGNLLIKSVDDTRQKTIQAYKVTDGYRVYLTVGEVTTPSGNADKTLSPKLTLENVRLKGVENSDSLVRVSANAEFTMDKNAAISGHKNSSTDANGNTGNGSALCIVDTATFTMKSGAVIEENESTQNSASGSGTSTNRNRVGGVYTYGSVTLNINGGQIVDNKCTEGNTKDLYATEGCTFNFSGNVMIDEITLNGDADFASINASQLGSLADVKLSLRSTAAINTVASAWNGKPVIKGKSGGTVASDDVAKFHLIGYKGNNGFIKEVELDKTKNYIDNDGKLVVRP